MRSVWSDRRGAASVIVAASGAVLLAGAAVGVDLGSIYLESRRLQGVADLAALAAARDPANAQAAADATVAANALRGPVIAEVQVGTYQADPAIPAERRFVPGGAAPNAARVTLRGQAPLAFGAAILGRTSADISRSATAAAHELASFSIGSRLVSLDGGIANALLSGLTGSSVRLSAMDYQALATADVELLRYLPGLRTAAGVQAGSFDSLLEREVTAPAALGALADLLEADGQTRAAAGMRALAAAASDGQRLRFGELIDLGAYGAQDRVGAVSQAKLTVDALDLANAILLAAQAGRQVSLDLALAAPGLAGGRAWLAIGERHNHSPWLSVTADREVILRTAQMRLYVELATPLNDGLLGSALQVRLPVLVQLAEGRARLDGISCTPEQVRVLASPGIGRLSIGEIDTDDLNDFRGELAIAPARLLTTPILSVTAQAQLRVGGAGWQAVTFSAADIQSGAVHTVATTDAVQASVAGLLGDTEIGVQALGLTLPTVKTRAASVVTDRLQTLAAPLDVTINGLTDLLGVGLGELDVRVNGLRCRDPVLVG